MPRVDIRPALAMLLTGELGSKLHKISATTIESVVLLLLSLLGVVQGADLILRPDPVALYDAIGPGRFVLVISAVLMVAGLTYLVRNRTPRPPGQATGPAHTSKKALYTTVSLVMYVALMDVLGFLLASILFLFLMFTFSRNKPWWRNAMLAIIYVLLIYALFVQVFDMELPRGLIAEKWLAEVLEKSHGPV